MAVVFSTVAIVGYFVGPPGYLAFLVAALVCAVAAEDIKLTANVIKVLRMIWPKAAELARSDDETTAATATTRETSRRRRAA
jgi:hypothetical protein